MKEFWSTSPAPLRAALVAAVLGFVISIESWSTRTGSGGFECSYTDYGALIMGAVAIIASLVAVFAVRKMEDPQVWLYALAAAALVVGVIHIFRGTGAIGGVCNS